MLVLYDKHILIVCNDATTALYHPGVFYRHGNSCKIGYENLVGLSFILFRHLRLQ